MFRVSLINATPAQQQLAAQAAGRLRDVAVSANAALDDVDAVWIAGPIAERAELAGCAARSGKHVLSELPLADSADAVEQITRQCAAAGVKLMAASTLRFRPSIAAIKRALDSKKLGQTALLRVHAWQSLWAEGVADLDPLVVQYLDLAHWMFASLPTEIFVQGRSPRPVGCDWPDYVQIHLGFPNGGMALISLCQGLPAGDNYESLSVVGSTGAAYADDHYQTQLLYRGDKPFAFKSSEALMTTTALLREFVSVVSQNREPGCAVGDAQTALQLAAAARQSLLAGQPVHLQEAGYVLGR